MDPNMIVDILGHKHILPEKEFNMIKNYIKPMTKEEVNVDHDNKKEVDFYTYCKTCLYSEACEDSDPCRDCLAVGARTGTRKPECWKEKV